MYSLDPPGVYVDSIVVVYWNMENTSVGVLELLSFILSRYYQVDTLVVHYHVVSPIYVSLTLRRFVLSKIWSP